MEIKEKKNAMYKYTNVLRNKSYLKTNFSMKFYSFNKIIRQLYTNNYFKFYTHFWVFLTTRNK